VSTEPNRLAALALVVLALAAMAAQPLQMSASRLQPRNDEVDYIAVARDYHRMGGTVAVVRCHLDGRCLEDNRSPAYELALQAFAHDGPGFYADAKLITVATALLLGLAVLVVGWKVFSPPVGIVSVALLALMPTHGDISSGVLADVLFAAVLFVSVFAIGAAFNRGPFAWAGAGALVGLAYLTKGNGHLALLGLVTAGCSLEGRRFFRPARAFALAVAASGFAAVTFFLLYRNTKVFGNPFHNFNDPLLWLDDRDQIWRVMREPGWERVGVIWYLERHSLAALVLRVLKGAGQVIGVLLYTSGLGVVAARPIEQPPVWAALVRASTGLVVLALAVRGMRSRLLAGHRAEVLVVLHVSFWILLAFAIGAQGVGVGTRFVLPISVLMVPYAGQALVDRASWAAARLPRPAPREAAASLLMLFLALSVALGVKLARFGRGFASNPRLAFAVPNDWAETSAWFASHLVVGERYAFPDGSLYSTWDQPSADPRGRWTYVYSVPTPEMLRVLSEANAPSSAPRWDGPARPVTKIFVDVQAGNFSTYADKLSQERDDHGPLTFLGWPRCFADSGRPSRFLVYCRPSPS
jgi:hypothetical protein